MQSAPLLTSLPGPLWSGVLAPGRVLSMGRIELNCVLMLNWIVWNRNVLTFCYNVYSVKQEIKVVFMVVNNQT